VVILKDTVSVTEKINEIKQKWADPDGFGEELEFENLTELDLTLLDEYYSTVYFCSERRLMIMAREVG